MTDFWDTFAALHGEVLQLYWMEAYAILFILRLIIMMRVHLDEVWGSSIAHAKKSYFVIWTLHNEMDDPSRPRLTPHRLQFVNLDRGLKPILCRLVHHWYWPSLVSEHLNGLLVYDWINALLSGGKFVCISQCAVLLIRGVASRT